MDFSAVRHDYDEDSTLIVNQKSASSVDLDTVFGQDLFSAKAWDSVEVEKEGLSATTPEIRDTGCAVPFWKKIYVDLVQLLAELKKDAPQMSETDKCKFVKPDDAIKKLSFKL